MGGQTTHTHNKENGREDAPIIRNTGKPRENPSFVYRQDGYELSYAIVDMIPERKSFVKEKFSLREFRREKTNQAK